MKQKHYREHSNEIETQITAVTYDMTTEMATALKAAGRKRRRSPAKSTTKKSPATTTKSTKNAQTTKRKTGNINNDLPFSHPPTRMLLVDNGGDSIKYGWIDNNSIGATDTAEKLECSTSPSYPHKIPNVSARLMHQFTTLVGDELNRVQNPNSLMTRTRSTERGIICNLENQTRVWKRMLDLLGVRILTHSVTAKCLGWSVAGTKKSGKFAVSGTGILPEKAIAPQTISVILLLPPHYPRILLDQIITIWMEDFGVSHVGLGISSVCASYDQSHSTPWNTSCTVDLGWSSTLVVPTFQNKLIRAGNYRKDIETSKTQSVASTIRRMPFGGRHMINMLKYYMSYRQYNLMDQETLIRDVFERLSYISTDIGMELKIARDKPSGRRPYDRDFVLPDYSNTSRGEIRIPVALQRDLDREEQKKKEEQQHEGESDDDEDEEFCSDDLDDLEDGTFDDVDDIDRARQPNKGEGRVGESKQGDVENADTDEDDEEESLEGKRKRLLRERAEEERRKREQQEEEQVLRLSVERFAIPEILFRPVDAGLQSDLVGLSRAIVQSVEACPECYRPALYRTVYLVGGLALLPNLYERLKRELRSLVPIEYDVELYVCDSPIDRAWMGAKSYFEKEHYAKSTVSRHEWEMSSKRKAYNKLLIENGGCYV